MNRIIGLYKIIDTVIYIFIMHSYIPVAKMLFTTREWLSSINMYLIWGKYKIHITVYTTRKGMICFSSGFCKNPFRCAFSENVKKKGKWDMGIWFHRLEQVNYMFIPNQFVKLTIGRNFQSNSTWRGMHKIPSN